MIPEIIIDEITNWLFENWELLNFGCVYNLEWQLRTGSMEMLAN